MARQLNLDRDQLDACYDVAGRIVSHAQKYIQRHSSYGIERATLRLMGVHGTYRGISHAALMVEKLSKDRLRQGAATWWGRALAAFPKENPTLLAEKLGRGKIGWESLPEAQPSAIRQITTKLAREGVHRVEHLRKPGGGIVLSRYGTLPQRAVLLEVDRPKKVREGVRFWSDKGASFSVVRLVLKKNLEETFAAEEWDSAWKDLAAGKCIPVADGLSSAEQTVSALELGFRTVAAGGDTGAVTGEVEPKRALVDLDFTLRLCARFEAKVLGGHAALGGLLDTARGPEILLALLLMFEQMATAGGLSLESVILNSFPVIPEKERGVSLLLACAQVVREMFPQSLLGYRIPSSADPMTLLAAFFSEQNILFAGADEGLFAKIREWGGEFEGYGQEFVLNNYGKIARIAHALLERTLKTLGKVEHLTLWGAFEKDVFGIQKKAKNPAGGDGIFQKSYHYWNPLSEMLGPKRHSRG